MRLKSALLGFGLWFSAQGLQAADGSSGCGPGWYVFKETSILSSSLRSTTNGLLFPVYTLGMTFGTSNCAKHSLVLENQKSLHFATQSYDLLRRDLAQGQGTHLNAYLASFGCHAWARPTAAAALQAAFGRELYLTVSPEAIVDTTRALIDSNETLHSCCS